MAHKEMTMMFVGDNYFVDYENPETVFDYALATFQKADLLFGNMEMPITDYGERVVNKSAGDALKGEKIFMRMRLNAIDAFKKAHFDVIALATNHTMDFGPEGLFQTIDLLHGAGIETVGAGHNIDEAHTPVILTKNGYRVAILAYTSVCAASFPATKDKAGVARIRVHTAYEPPPRFAELPGAPPIVITRLEPEDIKMLRGDISKARDKADIVVVSWHWGVSHESNVLEYQKEGGHACIDAGADLVVGHHSNTLQGIEVYKGKAIAFGLGAFAAYVPNPNLLTQVDRKSLILRCDIDGKAIKRISFIPSLMNDRWQPEVVSGEKAKPIIDKMTKLSSAMGTTIKPVGDEVEVIFK